MINKKAIVTGVSGQDGYYLAKLLVDKGYDVIGIVHSIKGREKFDERIKIVELDMRNYNSVYSIVCDNAPNEIYNFAAQSSSIYSWEDTIETCELNFMTVAAILQAIRDCGFNTRFFQASSAEIFGRDPVDIPQKIDTRQMPVTPYATAKTASGMLISNYRDHYGVFAINGIFYNHESIRRKETFLPAKITRTVAAIKLGVIDCLYVGNINSMRDWGYAPDYMYAAWKVMQLDEPHDYVFATGITHTVREMIEESFRAAEMPIVWRGEGIDEEGIVEGSERTVVRIDKKYYREYDRNNSVGDPSTLFDAIDWRPPTSFAEMIRYMTHYYEDNACDCLKKETLNQE